MRNIIYIVACLIFPCICQAADLIDDFDDYSTGTIVSPWVQTDGTPVIAQDVSSNQYLQGYGCYLPLDIHSISDTDTETTVFYRIYKLTDTSPDCSVGLGYLSAPTGDWTDFEAYVTIYNSELRARNNSNNDTMISAITDAEWYNIWLVLNNSANTYDVYVTTGMDEATIDGAQKGNDLGFRNDQGDLLSFKVYGRDSAAVRIDDIYISSGTNLSIPTTQYVVDDYTLHLYHFEDGTDSAGSFDLATYNSATISESSLSTYDGGASTTGYICADASGYTTQSDLSNFIGTDGSFTFEAMVKPLMEPGTAGNQEIICCESDSSNTDRGFQFRIESSGTTLRFQTLSGSTVSYDATISYTAGNWYHAAVTYYAATGKLKMYWTPKGDSIDQVGSWSSVTALNGSTSTLFCIGNELRSVSGYGNENFEGLIDEVRISGIAREVSDMSTGGGYLSPEVITSPSDLTLNDNDDAVFEAVFSSQTYPFVNWYKINDSGDVLIDDSEMNIDILTLYDDDNDEYTSTLTITDVGTTDFGQYYCQITNSSGYPQDTESANLIVYGLTAHWTLDQSSYSNGYYAEEIGGYDASVNGTPAFVTGPDNVDYSAVEISQTDGWALASELDPVKQSGELTICLWANWYESSLAQQDIIVDSITDGSLIDTNGLLSDGNWQYICTVFDGSTIKLYVDSVLKAEQAWTFPTETSAFINIGLNIDEDAPFNGAIDDVKIYNVALTQTEIANLRYDFSNEQSCILAFDATYDLSGPDGQPDCTINDYDLAEFASGWLVSHESYGIEEFSDFAAQWLSSGLYPVF